MNNGAVTQSGPKGLRVIKTLTPIEQYIRALEKNQAYCIAAIGRAHKDLVERNDEARRRLGLAETPAEPVEATAAGAENTQEMAG